MHVAVQDLSSMSSGRLLGTGEWVSDVPQNNNPASTSQLTTPQSSSRFESQSTPVSKSTPYYSSHSFCSSSRTVTPNDDLSNGFKLEDIVDLGLRGKVQQLSTLAVEDTSILYLRNLVMACKYNINIAVDALFGEFPEQLENDIKNLIKMHPGSKREHVFHAFVEAIGDIGKANCLLETRLESLKEDMGGACHSSTSTHVKGRMHNFTYRHHGTDLIDNKYSIQKKPTEEAGNPASPPTHIKKEVPSNLPAHIKQEDKINEETEDGNPPSFESNSRHLCDIFGGIFNLNKCQDVLQAAGDDMEKAYEMLAEELKNPRRGSRKRQNSSHSRVKDNGEGPSNWWYSSSSNNSPEPHPAKRQKEQANLYSVYDEDDEGYGSKESVTLKKSVSLKEAMASKEPAIAKKPVAVGAPVFAKVPVSSEDDINSKGPVALEPVGPWISKYFPGGEYAVIILGAKKESRATIPKKLLCEASARFNAYFMDDSNDGTLKLPDINLDMFELALQCLVTKSISLAPNAQRSISDEISIILDIFEVSKKLGFPAPGEPVINLLRHILIQKRGALKCKHIFKAYTLGHKHPVQKLFTEAVIQHYMRTRSGDLDEDNGYESADDEDLGDAHIALYFSKKFRYARVRDEIDQFVSDMHKAQDKVLSRPIEKLLKVNGRTSKKGGGITVTFYTDPLNPDDQFQFGGQTTL